ncbi:MAG: N-6 DNA methylase [Erysipelotrichales bacterium]|nr:N-6 DNA methylase [Erysipelotrichales bacterium]
MAKKKIQSVEPQIADLANSWMRSYGLDYKLEQESLNSEIDKALEEYYTKNGGSGANRPDAKLLLKDEQGRWYPVMIEYKGYKDKLEKLDAYGIIENKNSKNEAIFNNINSYAVNGAVHYANAILHYTSFTDIISIGMTGWKDEESKLKYKIGVYYVSKSNLGTGQKIGEFTDFSFLAPNNFNKLIEIIERLNLPQEELDRIKAQKDREISHSLMKLNNDIYKEEKNLSEKERVYLVAASIIATLGIPNKVPSLKPDDLKSLDEFGNKDGDILLRKIQAFLEYKNIPREKKDIIIRTLQNTITNDNINKVENGETQLKRVFKKIVDDLGIYYKIGLTTDFTGKLFNEMYGWMGFTQDPTNDVVLTPSYIATLLVKLARINKDSFVWDFATGSAGLLVAAMNEMLQDARNKISSPDELIQKELKIKAEQLLGLEILQEIYMLAVLNMILMGDGSSNILNKDSLVDFDGKYITKGDKKTFPADAFVLNPPYSAEGNGMIFVKKALNMMSHGYAAIIIQGSAGKGKAKDINTEILKKHTLLASIKMPTDLFIGKSSVQTYIYVFRVNEPHAKDDIVKFIDFSNDGYTRTNRKKAANNLKDTDNARERYEELVNLVRFGKSYLHLIGEDNYYEGRIDPENGCDWNQRKPVDFTPKMEDFQKVVSDYMIFKINEILKVKIGENSLGK